MSLGLPISEYKEAQLYVAHNRKNRRRIAREAGVPWPEARTELKVRNPIFLGIRQFKNVAGRSLIKEYKDNAWRSQMELNSRMRGENKAS